MGQQAYGDEAWSGPYTAYVGRPRRRSPNRLLARAGAAPLRRLRDRRPRPRPLCEPAVRGAYQHLPTLEEVIVVCDIRDLSGHPLTEQDLPEAQVLLEGEEIGQSLLRMRCPADGRQIVLASDCRPVRTAEGRVIGAVVIAREVSEEVALAIGVRQVSEGRVPADHAPVG